MEDSLLGGGTVVAHKPVARLEAFTERDLAGQDERVDG
jgi:hypothetical protein